MYVCVCLGVTDRQIRREVDQGARTLSEVQMQLPVGACCGRCVDTAEALIHDHLQPKHAHCSSRSPVRMPEPALA